MTPLLARCVRGLEWLAGAELAGRLDARLVSAGHRELRAEVTRLDRRALDLRTADDLFVVIEVVGGVGRARTSLQTLEQATARADVSEAVEAVRGVRALDTVTSFVVTASFLGRRNYNRQEIEDSLGAGLSRATGWRYETRDSGVVPRADVSIRVHLSADEAVVGLRVAARPLHRREYKIESGQGSLHPPLAAAMCLVAGAGVDAAALDPCAGAGTIPIEGLRLPGPARWLAGDIDQDACARAAANADAAGVGLQVAVVDAGRLPLPDACMDGIASNLPWSRTVRARGSLAGGPEALYAQVERVLRPAGRAVLLAGDDAPVAEVPAGLRIDTAFRVSVSGAWATVLVLTPADAPAVGMEGLAGALGPYVPAAASACPPEFAPRGA